MVSVKNPKEIEIKGDYNLVYNNGQLVAIILVAVEHTRRQRHQGGNSFLVYGYDVAKGYALTYEREEEPEEGDIKLAKYNGYWRSLRLHKVVETRNTEDSVLVRVPASLIKVEQYSSIDRPLNVKWSYSWHEYDTKERVEKTVYLSDVESDCIHVEKLFSRDNLKKEFWRQAPTLQQMRREGESNWVSALRSYNGNILVRFESRDMYVWYKPDGTPLTYSDEGEWWHLWPNCSGDSDDIDGVLEWIKKENEKRGGYYDQTDDEEEYQEPRRIRRGRSGERRERLAQQEAAEAEAASEEE